MSPTPQFVRWTVARRCLLRDGDDWQQPERAERQLQALRVLSEALADGRLLDGICVRATADQQPPAEGFRAGEVFDAYGGEAFVRDACRGCSANVLQSVEREAIAGCFGMFDLSPAGDDFLTLVDQAIVDTGRESEFAVAFISTQPRWYGLWIGRIESPLRYANQFSITQIALHTALAERLVDRHASLAAPLRKWRAALAAVAVTGDPLFAAIFPPGEIVANRWIVAAHCPLCRAARDVSRRPCPVCRSTLHPLPSRRRCVRGSRPYWPLRGFLNDNALADFLARYANRPDAAQS